MKEKIYTIPVNEGFDAKTECPFCAMYEKLEKDALGYTMGPAYMEQDVRDRTNEQGFCHEHYKTMFEMQNRLGLSLMVSTHMEKIQSKMTELLKRECEEKKKGFKKKQAEEQGISQYLEELSGKCFVCEKIENNLKRYFETFFYLWKKEEAFREKVTQSKGFCVEHFGRLVSLSKKELSEKQRKEFLNAIIPLQNENMERVKEELLWFISKFDYRFKDEPWGNSKDALARSIVKVAAYNAEKKYDVSR